MKRIFIIAWKDLLMTLRDPISLLIMLATPIGLTVVVAFAFGGLSNGNNSSGLNDIPVAIVNLDTGEYGKSFAEAFMPSAEQITSNPQSKQIADLVEAKLVSTVAEAHKLVDDEEYAATLEIPETFSQSINPYNQEEGMFSSAITPTVITMYVNPARTISANIIRSIAQAVIDQFMAGSTAGEIAISSLVTSGRLSPADVGTKGVEISTGLVKVILAEESIKVDSTVEQRESTSSKGFNWLAYMAPSMAVMYLMFTMSNASRTILNEQQSGTLPRMLISPTSRTAVLGGKMLGVYLTGLLQMAVLILTGNLLFNISYGPAFAVLIFTTVLVAAATAWGMLEAAIAKSAGQAKRSRLGNQLDLCRTGR